MSDRRYKWTLIVCCITAIIVAAIWKAPATLKALENRQSGLGEYVYVDGRTDLLHVNRRCKKINIRSGQRAFIHRWKLSELKDRYYDACPYCVSDKDYEKLEKMRK